MKKTSRTCIAAIKTRRNKIIMAGDRRASIDWGLATLTAVPKVRKINGFLIGFTGDCYVADTIINNFIPELKGDLDTYLRNDFLKGLSKCLRQHGYRDEHDLLRLQKDGDLELLIAHSGRLFSVVFNPGAVQDGAIEPSIIGIDESVLPWATGCGGSSALPILLAEKRREGHSTKEHLQLAMEIACEISPGCGLPLDFISE